MVTNLAYFYETSRKVRGGKWVWVKDSNGENRNNILLGGTIANPSKGFGHLWAAQLMQYTPSQPIYIFRSFGIAQAAEANATVIYVKGDGYSDVPEEGMLLMVAPDEATDKGKSVKVNAVEFIPDEEKFKVTLSAALGAALTTDSILVEAAGDAPANEASVLVPNPNIFNEADREMMPTEGFGVKNANYSVSGVYNKQAWIARMQPLPKYVLAKNRSYIDGIFWI